MKCFACHTFASVTKMLQGPLVTFNILTFRGRHYAVHLACSFSFGQLICVELNVFVTNDLKKSDTNITTDIFYLIKH